MAPEHITSRSRRRARFELMPAGVRGIESTGHRIQAREGSRDRVALLLIELRARHPGIQLPLFGFERLNLCGQGLEFTLLFCTESFLATLSASAAGRAGREGNGESRAGPAAGHVGRCRTQSS